MVDTTSMSFRQLLAKLESRFGQELVETVQVKFQTATQQPGEELSDWADRIRSLAARAFQDLPEHYCTQQVVNRFLQGMTDKEAGQHVCMGKPVSLQQAINDVLWYQHVHNAMVWR